MSRIAVISPHLDDGPFSVGEHMLSRPDDEFTIVTICGTVPSADPHFDKYMTLLHEHDEVCRRGGWAQINGPMLDDAAAGYPVRVDEAVDWLTSVLQRTSPNAFRDLYDEWWVPFGIHHPDHRSVRRAVCHIGRPSARIRFYEELPYRVLYPAEAVQLRAGVWGELVGLGPLGEQLEAKQRLCRLYSSQMGPELERTLWVPERLWGIS